MRTFARLAIVFAVVGAGLVPTSLYAQTSGEAPEDESAVSEPLVTTDDGNVVSPSVGDPAPLVEQAPPATPVPAPAIPFTPVVQATLIATATGVIGPNHPAPTPSSKSSTTGAPLIRLLPDPSIQLPRVSQYDNSNQAINQVPSPVGAPIFSNLRFPIDGESYHDLSLAPSASATYSYNCVSGQCTGSAETVWRAMPLQQQQDYLTALVQAAKANQTWNPKVFKVGVRVRPGGLELACARASSVDDAVAFSASCA